MVKDNKGFQKKILLITGIFILLLVATGLLNKRNVVEVTSISLEQENVMIEIGRKMVLTGEIMPENATDWVLNWTSSDESVATVSASGEVSAVAAGTATITVKVANTNKRATCTIIVPVAFNNEEFEKQVRLLIGKPDGPILRQILRASPHCTCRVRTSRILMALKILLILKFWAFVSQRSARLMV